MNIVSPSRMVNWTKFMSPFFKFFKLTILTPFTSSMLNYCNFSQDTPGGGRGYTPSCKIRLPLRNHIPCSAPKIEYPRCVLVSLMKYLNHTPFFAALVICDLPSLCSQFIIFPISVIQ